VSEEDVRGGLQEAVADEPPLDFDPDALVAAARQQVTRRRALMAAGAATVVVVVAAVAIPVALGRNTTQVAQPPPTSVSTSTSETPVQWPPAGVTPAHYTADGLRDRSHQMAAHLREKLPALLPKASKFNYGEFGGEASGAFSDGQMYVNAPVSFDIENGRYSIFVTVWAPGAPEMSPDKVCTASGAYCKEVSKQDGGPIMAKTEDLGDQTISTLYHFRTSGSVVQIAAYNYDMAGNAVPKYQPTIPVTLDQLVRLATDPELGL
jgi:hypothetical protein